jgi:hypothetical protein
MRRWRMLLGASICGIILMVGQAGPSALATVTPLRGGGMQALSVASPSPAPSAFVAIVPDVRGMAEADAIDTLLATGLVPGYRAERWTIDMPAGLVNDTDPTAGAEVPAGTQVDYVVSLGAGEAPTLGPSPWSTPEASAEPSPGPSPGPSPAPSILVGSNPQWDAYFQHIQAFIAVANPTFTALSKVLADRDQAGPLAAMQRQASLDLLAWLDDSPPEPCYEQSWQAFHRAADLLVDAMDTLIEGGIDAASKDFMQAGGALIEAGPTIQDAGGACADMGTRSPCDTWPGRSVLITDFESGFSLRAPSNWRRLEPGDAGWVTLFGTYGSSVEQSVADGTIADFIVPVDPPDPDRNVNLAIYVYPVPTGGTLDTIARQTLGSLVRQHNFVDIADRGDGDLPAGRAAHITSVRTELPGEAPKRDAVEAYLLIHEGLAYNVGFVSSEATAGHYSETFGCIIASLQWSPADSSAVPGASIPAP